MTPPTESSRSAIDCPTAVTDPADQLDRHLVSLVADGNREALAKLYVRHGRVLLAQIQLLLADREMSEEVLQDTILAVWNGAGEFRGDSRVLSWMISIARRRTRDRLRRRRVAHLDDDVLVEQPDRGFGPESLALARVEVSAVASALKALRPAHREILGLVLGTNLPLAEVARVLEIPTGTVKSRLSAARAALITIARERLRTMNTVSPHLTMEELLAGTDGPTDKATHLAVCPSCEFELREWRQIRRAVSSIADGLDLPSGAVEEVFSQVDGPRKTSLNRFERGRGATRRRRLGVGALVASCAAVLIVVLVVAILAVSPLTPSRPSSATQPRPTSAVNQEDVGWQLVSATSGPWRSIAAPTNLVGLPRYKVICPSDANCYMLAWGYGSLTVDEVDATNDGGTTWRTGTLPTKVGPGAAMSCPSANTCAVLGLDPSGHLAFLETTDGGLNWSSASGPFAYGTNSFAESLSCVTAQECTGLVSQSSGGGSIVNSANGALTVTTSNGGTTWSQTALPASFAPSASGFQCVAPAACVIVGSTTSGSDVSSGDALYKAGGAWQQASLSSQSAPLESVTCADTTDCLATASVGLLDFGGSDSGSAALRSSDGGRTWTDVAGTGLPSGPQSNISCPSIGECWASGVKVPSNGGSTISISQLQGVLAVSTDEGRTWRSAPLPAGVKVVASVSCPSTTTCFAFAILQNQNGRPVFGLLTNRSE